MPFPLADVLGELERQIERLSPADAASVIGGLERLKALAWQRLVTPAEAPKPPTAAAAPDRSLGAKEAAEILGVKRRWIYDHAEEIPGARRLSARCLRFSERKLRRWISERST